MRRCLASVAASLLLLALPQAGAGSGAAFVTGFSDVAPERSAPAAAAIRQLGATAVRYTLQWSPGARFDGEQRSRLEAGVANATGLRILLSVYGTKPAAAPTTPKARTSYCAFVLRVLQQEPRIRDVVIWNEPNKAQFWSSQATAPAAYESLLAQCYDTLHTVPGLNILGFALAHNGNDDAASTSPGTFIRGVGDAFRLSGRRSPLFDTVAFQPYPTTSVERPWAKHVGSTTIGEGDWNKLMFNLWRAFRGTPQPLPGSPGVAIWYTEDGFQSAVPSGRRSQYTGSESLATVPEAAGGDVTSHPSAKSPAPDQATQILDAVALARCQPYVGAFFNFLVADEASLKGWQSAPLYPDLTRKASYAAFARALSGAVDCTALKGGVPSADYRPPSVPEEVSAVAYTLPLRVGLTWAPARDDGGAAPSYRVYRGGTFLTTVARTGWVDTSVAPRHAYSYTVRAIDEASNLGDASAAAIVTTPDVSPPTTPGSLTAVATDAAHVLLTWSASSDDVGVSAYELTRDGVVVATTTATSFTDAVAPGTHSYTVVALDAAGNRSGAASVVVTVPGA